MINRGITTVSGMIANGLYEMAGWLINALTGTTQRREFLTMRFPDAPPEVVDSGLALAMQAVRQSEGIESGGSEPIGTGFGGGEGPEQGNITSDVVIKVPKGESGEFWKFFYTVSAPGLTSRDDYLDYILDWIGIQLAAGDFGKSPESTPDEPIDLEALDLPSAIDIISTYKE